MVEKILMFIRILTYGKIALAVCHRVSYGMKLTLTEAFIKTISSPKTQLSLMELRCFPQDQLSTTEQFLADITFKLCHPTTLNSLILSCSASVNKYHSGLLHSTILSSIASIITLVTVYSSGAYISLVKPIITTIICLIWSFKSSWVLKNFYAGYLKF